MQELTFEQWLVHIRRELGYQPEMIKRYEAAIGTTQGIQSSTQRPARTGRNDSKQKKKDHPVADGD
jgi:uncharacterized protein YecA (UPF0149 family)